MNDHKWKSKGEIRTNMFQNLVKHIGRLYEEDFVKSWVRGEHLKLWHNDCESIQLGEYNMGFKSWFEYKVLITNVLCLLWETNRFDQVDNDLRF